MKVDKVNILLIEDEEYDVRRIRNTLQPFKEMVIRNVVSDGQSALELLRKDPNYDVVIMDFQISGGLFGENLIQKIKEIDSTFQIIVITKMTLNVTDFTFANKLLDAGAIWYCTKYPGDIDEYIYQPTDFILNIVNARERKKLERARLATESKLDKQVQDILSVKKIIGSSPEITALKQKIERFANSNANVLIYGQSGTGKELVAANLHYMSDRKRENFVAINCGSLPGHLVESELFGFEKGAFTGATSNKKGLFELANKGTIFLDEISELPPGIQSKLLRVIQEGEIDKIGRTSKFEVDVRILAATNKNLLEEIENKKFRKDLYYRLNVASIKVPSLASRKEDISGLAEHFIRQHSAESVRGERYLDDDAMQVLIDYNWPGNVRELQNVVQRFLLLSPAKIITSEMVEIALQTDEMFENPGSKMDEFRNNGGETGYISRWNKDEILPWREMEALLQEDYFQFVRENTNSDAEAARKLGLAPPNYYRMCKRLGLK